MAGRFTVVPRVFPQRLLICVALATLLCLPHGGFAAENQQPPKEYVFGSFPFLATPTLEAMFAPIAAELAAALGRPVHFQSTSSFEKFSSNLEHHVYDIAHIQPFDYVRIAVKAGYIPLATRAEKLQGVFVVKADSPLKSPRDLRGKVIGFPPKTAAVSYLGKLALIRAGITLGTDARIQYFNTHQSCLQQLFIGSIDACACSPPAIRTFEAQSGRSVRAILSSPETPQALFVVHKRIPIAEREQIRKTVLETQLLGVEPTLRKVMAKKDATTGRYFVPVTDKDYNVVRRYLKEIGEQ